MKNIRYALALVLLAGCADVADIGGACTDSDDCMAGLSCATHGAEESVCMEDCVTSTTWICEDGLFCQPLGDASGVVIPDRGVCFLGGPLPAGASCLGRALDCEAGAACIVFEAGVREECRTVCRLDGEDCAEGEVCTALTGSPGGYCEAAP